jgi:hypothetical protein
MKHLKTNESPTPQEVLRDSYEALNKARERLEIAEARTKRLEAQYAALKCCATCGYGYEESGSMWCEGPKSEPGNGSPIMSPRHVCKDWKAREK